MAKEAAAVAGVRRLRERCCVLSDLLRRNVEVLVREARDVLALEEDYGRLHGCFVQLLARVGAAVCRLLAGDDDAVHAASDVLAAWLRAEDATRDDMRRMRLFSRAARGTPVSLLVKRAEQTAVRVSAAIPETKPHKRCVKKVAALQEQVKALCPWLQQSARTLQHLLYLTRALPLLRQFDDRLQSFNTLDQQDKAPAAEAADVEDERAEPSVSSLYCGGPLWTRLTAEVCHHYGRPQRLAHLLSTLPRRLHLNLDPGPDFDLNLDHDLELELGLCLERLEGRGTKREASPSPTRNALIGVMEDEDDLQPIKIPHLDPTLFKPLPD